MLAFKLRQISANQEFHPKQLRGQAFKEGKALDLCRPILLNQR
ncbi:MAG: hypothetical protein ACI9O0_000366 [Paracoccaceae bacterium]|jgi:hypothetical protein